MTRERLLLLHGSVMNAARSFRLAGALAERFELVPLDRPGFPPGPPVERVDWARDAAWLPGVVEPGDHLVAHSYGGVVALVAAPELPLRSLTVIEPPAFAVARGHPAVETWLARAEALPRDDVRTHLTAFLEHVGASFPLPDPLPPDLRQGAEAFFDERWTTDAEIRLEPLPYPVLVVTGDHEPCFEAIGDALERGLHAKRVVLPGAGHAVQSAPGFDEALLAFLDG